MDDELLTIVENQEADEPEVTINEGEKEPGVINTEMHKDENPERDAELDAALEQMRSELERLESENKLKDEALSMFFEGDDPAMSAIATAQEKSIEEVRTEFKERQRITRLEAENEILRNNTIKAQAETAMQQDLAIVQGLDPKIKDLKELGDTFISLISAGVDATDAYYAAKTRMEKEQRNPPKEIGAVNKTPAEKDFYSKTEVEAMSDEDISKNYQAIRKSMQKW